MLAQLLNQEFLVDAAEDTRVELNRLAEQVRRRGAADAGLAEEVTADDLREVAEELRKAVDELEAEPDEAKASRICMPRDPLLSILQSELEAGIETQAPPSAIEHDPDAPLDRRLAEDPRQAAGGRRAFAAFEVTRRKILSDPKWVWNGVTAPDSRCSRRLSHKPAAALAAALATEGAEIERIPRASACPSQ